MLETFAGSKMAFDQLDTFIAKSCKSDNIIRRRSVCNGPVRTNFLFYFAKRSRRAREMSYFSTIFLNNLGENENSLKNVSGIWCAAVRMLCPMARFCNGCMHPFSPSAYVAIKRVLQLR